MLKLSDIKCLGIYEIKSCLGGWDVIRLLRIIGSLEWVRYQE